MARVNGEKLGRRAGYEHLKIMPDTGCVAAPKCLECPEPKCLEDMTLSERNRWAFQHGKKQSLPVEPPNKGNISWRVKDFADRCNTGEIHQDKEWAEIYSASSNLIATWRHKMRKSGVLTV